MEGAGIEPETSQSFDVSLCNQSQVKNSFMKVQTCNRVIYSQRIDEHQNSEMTSMSKKILISHRKTAQFLLKTRAVI